MLAKLENGNLKIAPSKIIVEGKTIFNPSDDILKEQGYKDVEKTEAPEVLTKTQRAVSSWNESDTKIIQVWSIEPCQPDATEVLQEIQTQAVIEKITASEDKTLGIQCMALFEVWTPENYSVGDVRTDPKTGYPYECITAHDSASNPDWTIENRTLWKPWHSRSADYALPWVQPTGAHDMYHSGEYMIWTDKKVKKCVLDTNFSPDEYPAAWEDA